MKREISLLILLLIIVTVILDLASIPVHEAGHFLAVNLVGGEVTRVVWIYWPLSFSTPAGEIWWNNVPGQWDWLICLAGGLFQGIVCFSLIVTDFFLTKNIFPDPYNFRTAVRWGFSATLLAFGLVGIATGLLEMCLWPLGRW